MPYCVGDPKGGSTLSELLIYGLSLSLGFGVEISTGFGFVPLVWRFLGLECRVYNSIKEDSEDQRLQCRHC